MGLQLEKNLVFPEAKYYVCHCWEKAVKKWNSERPYHPYLEKPNVTSVTKIAMLIVEKYPFMADSVTSSRLSGYKCRRSIERIFLCLGLGRKLLEFVKVTPIHFWLHFLLITWPCFTTAFLLKRFTSCWSTHISSWPQRRFYLIVMLSRESQIGSIEGKIAARIE